ncbi:MAG: DNA repair protein RecN, partial [Pseudomonadota bacterium]
GETGAGKSILLDALGFVLGWRGRADLVRLGAAQGEVTAVFALAPDHPALSVLEEAGLPCEDGELLLRRVNTREGRKSAYVNDRSCSASVLRALSECLVELHGQQDDKGLLDTRVHRDLLDAYGNYPKEIEGVRVSWVAMRDAKKALDAAIQAREAAVADEAFLRHAVEELARLAPETGEEAELDRKRRLMQSAEKIRDDVARAAAALANDGAEGRLTDALRWLEDVAPNAEGALDGALAALSRALIEVGEASDQTDIFLRGLAFEPIELEQTEERLFALRGLARKHMVAPDDLADHAETLRTRLEALDSGARQLSNLEAELAASQGAYEKATSALTAARRDAAKNLDAAMAEELAPLKMERAEFRTEIGEDSAGPAGVDRVTFTVATNPGAPSGPLNKIASGGELSRFLLALKVCLTAGESGLTLIFDEIDRGVGGATADAVGRRLKALAEDGQVMVVTHSPQVAALAKEHWRVEKSVTEGQTLSRVVPLAPDDRVDEIARMISGDRVTEAAKQAAQALLGAA